MRALLLIAEPVIAPDSSQRPLLRRQLEIIGQRLNEHRRPPAPYQLNRSDQIVAADNRADRLITDLPQLAASVHPVQLRCVLCPTESESLVPQPESPLWQDVDQAMAGLTARHGLLAVTGLGPGTQSLADGGLGLYSHLVRKWQPNRLAILAHLLAGWKVERIALGLGISEQAVYKNINQGGLTAVIRLLTALAASLDAAICDDQPGGSGCGRPIRNP